MLSPVNRVGGRRHSRSRLMVGRQRRDRYDDYHQHKNHREPKSETISFLCHLFPSWQRTEVAMADFRRRIWERSVSYFTLQIIGILMETIKDLYISAHQNSDATAEPSVSEF